MILLYLIASCLCLLVAALLALRIRRKNKKSVFAEDSHAACQQTEDQRTSSSFLDAALLLELLATLQETGLSVPVSLGYIADLDSPYVTELLPVAQRLASGMNWQQAWGKHTYSREIAKVQEALAPVVLTGAPSSSLLRASAGRLRRSENRRAEQAAARLSVKLVMPLGLCSLPAFICLGIVPVLFALVPHSFS